ncbi:MAG: MraY family glycosyltransferase [Bacteroidetes bacterium]|nr:MraY family glycosyltransferase [Bacteroidota bacterium]MDA0904144.1 MraY family glycosyltransferase [Bacteroidota bacterium]MDA1242668.1 MraY family glycosyltransferase [Bacteroidota bacterium]
MISLMLPGIMAFAFVLFGMPTLIMVAKRKHLLDEPTEARKLHHRAVPTVGGVIVFAGIFTSSLLSFSVAEEPADMRWIGVLGALIPVFFMGLKDDILGMSPYRKLLVHLAVGLFLVVALDWRIKGFGGLFGLEALPQTVSWAFSLFVYVVIVNAINLIDGVDGLAGGFGVIFMGGVSSWFWGCGDSSSALVALSVLGALLGFLVYNFHPAKIFLGDSGALMLGLLAYVFAVGIMESDPPATMAHIPAPIAAMSMMAYPLVDTLRVFTIRVLQGRSPFSPDRLHIHHLMIELGWGHRMTSAAVWVYTLVFIGLAFQPITWLEGHPTIHFLAMLLLAFGLGSIPHLLLHFGVKKNVEPQSPPPPAVKGKTIRRHSPSVV